MKLEDHGAGTGITIGTTQTQANLWEYTESTIIKDNQTERRKHYIDIELREELES